MESIKFANQLTDRLKKYLKSHKIENNIPENQWEQFTTDTFMTIQDTTVDTIINRLEAMLLASGNSHKFSRNARNQLTHIIGSLTMKYLY